MCYMHDVAKKNICKGQNTHLMEITWEKNLLTFGDYKNKPTKLEQIER